MALAATLLAKILDPLAFGVALIVVLLSRWNEIVPASHDESDRGAAQ